jgi:hypothetical protein
MSISNIDDSHVSIPSPGGERQGEGEQHLATRRRPDRHHLPSTIQLLFGVPDEDSADFLPLPRAVRDDVDRTMLALEVIHNAGKVNPACKQVAASLALHRPLTWHALRRKYYAYIKSGNWRDIVDWTRCKKINRPNAGQSDQEALPPDFVDFLKGLMGRNQRKSEPAIRALYRLWQAGESIPGYGTWQEHFQAQHPFEPLPRVCPPDKPRGWSKSNLRRYIPEAAELALSREGIAAARRHLPEIMMTRAGLRPLEFIMFDDVRTDFRILVPGCPGPVQLNLLVALDLATGMILRYGLRPAIEREDGMKDKLKLRDMKTLVAGILFQYGLPRNYPMTLVVENATAAIRDSFAAALNDLGRSLGTAVQVHRTEMICGTALWCGYKDKAGGNPGGKAALESTFNLLHNEAAFLPGQIGRRYDAGPAELAGRTREAEALVKTARHLTPHERAALKMPFLTAAQARVVLTDIFANIVNRTDHRMEGFSEFGEWREANNLPWRPDAEFPGSGFSVEKVQWHCRKESPVERWFRLCADIGQTGTVFVKPHSGTIARLYEEHKLVSPIGGEIVFQYDKESFVYRIANVANCKAPIKNKAQYLAYFDPADLSWIHLTDGEGGYVGSIPRTSGIRRTDKEALKLDFKRKRTELEALQKKVSDRIPEVIENRIADIDTNTQVLSDALVNSGAFDNGQSGSDYSTEIDSTKRAITATAEEIVQAEEQERERQARAPRGLGNILAGL